MRTTSRFNASEIIAIDNVMGVAHDAAWQPAFCYTVKKEHFGIFEQRPFNL